MPAEEYFNKLKSYAEKAASDKNMSVQSVSLHGNASREIVKYAETNCFDLVVEVKSAIPALSAECLAQRRIESVKRPTAMCS